MPAAEGNSMPNNMPMDEASFFPSRLEDFQLIFLNYVKKRLLFLFLVPWSFFLALEAESSLARLVQQQGAQLMALEKKCNELEKRLETRPPSGWRLLDEVFLRGVKKMLSLKTFPGMELSANPSAEGCDPLDTEFPPKYNPGHPRFMLLDKPD